MWARQVQATIEAGRPTRSTRSENGPMAPQGIFFILQARHMASRRDLEEERQQMYRRPDCPSLDTRPHRSQTRQTDGGPSRSTACVNA